MLGCGVLLVGACGNTKRYVNHPRPPLPVNLTVYVNDSRVSVSPATVTIGPAVFIVTNQASKAESISVFAAGGGGGQALASTAPINPQGTAQVAVDFTHAGSYTVGTDGNGSTDASVAQPPGIQAAHLRVAGHRAGGGSTLLVP